MRIALVSPYSWTYPGGVTRHIEALADEFRGEGHEARILTPYDPDDLLARRLHSGARPRERALPEHVIPLGRTVGLAANGAVSNLALSPAAVMALRTELREGGYDVVHIHEPVAWAISWDALLCGLPLVGTFHCYSENGLTNGVANLVGARRRFNRLHVRIAVSRAAEWTGRRFFGGRYTVVPNGVRLQEPRLLDIAADGQVPSSGWPTDGMARPLRILFVGQAVERKGLPVALRAFEALREHIPATLTLVGAGPEEVAPLLLDDRGVVALGKVSEAEKDRRLAEADVLCAPSLGGESFGMVLTEAFAASTPVVAADIPGYRDVVRDGRDGELVAPGDPVALAEALRGLALDPDRRARMAVSARERAERFAWPRVAGEVMECYERAIALQPDAARSFSVRHGLAPADLQPRVRPDRLPSLQPASVMVSVKRVLGTLRGAAVCLLSLLVIVMALFALRSIGVDRVAASLLASSPGLVAGALGVMCASMFVRGFAWHAILRATRACRDVRRRDVLRGTFIGVLMSATLPARLGEPARALIVARRIGRPRETLPVVVGTMVSQTLMNLLVLCILGAVMFSSARLFAAHDRPLIAASFAPVGLLAMVLVAPTLVPAAAASRSARLQALLQALSAFVRRALVGLAIYRRPRRALVATVAQLGAWGLQWLSCWLLLVALGLGHRVGMGGAAAILFAVNITAIVPATPANVGIFQAACVAVMSGAYHVGVPDAIAYGMILQAIEIAMALAMGMPALVREGLSWKELRMRTLDHVAPVQLGPLPAKGPVAAGATRAEG